MMSLYYLIKMDLSIRNLKINEKYFELTVKCKNNYDITEKCKNESKMSEPKEAGSKSEMYSLHRIQKM